MTKYICLFFILFVLFGCSDSNLNYEEKVNDNEIIDSVQPDEFDEPIVPDDSEEPIEPDEPEEPEEPIAPGIFPPSLIYNGAYYQPDFRVEVNLDGLELTYIGQLNGLKDLTTRPEEQLETNTFPGYYVFRDKYDSSNKYLYVSEKLTVSDSDSFTISVQGDVFLFEYAREVK